VFGKCLKLDIRGASHARAIRFALSGLPKGLAVDAAALAADVVCRAIEATEPGHWYGVSFEKVIPWLAREVER